MERIQPKIRTALDYVSTHRSNVIVYTAIAALIIFFIALFIYNNPNKIVYQPTKACDLLTPAEAQKLLDDDVISTEKNTPLISENTATSKCSYSDRNPDSKKMKVVAVAIRSGINDEGDMQNKVDFEANKQDPGIELVKNVGDDAFFNEVKGQLNVLSGHNWIILSFGAGSSPEKNSIEDALKLASIVL